ncbi:melanization protease 1 [Drosophila sechellia]|uniref:GM15712 n=1 Tax=Drosophila sechellia TaxID=7238 RepID=B4I7R7_DROSE|nr:melanization protease 1 [Drosophila sechellia]EDW56642.1 GM15712 [Drosophila sechellia]
MKIAAAVIILLTGIAFGNGQNPVSFLEPNCGVSISSYGNGNAVPMITNGRPADMFANPWMALVHSGASMCGGSLITNRFVLSAAHCVSNNHTDIYLGEFDTSTDTDCSTTACMPKAIKIAVDAYVKHPLYVHYTQNDIALFRLATKVEFTDYVKPICLLNNFNLLNYVTALTATGWGLTEQGVPSRVLRTTTLTQVDRSYCSRMFGTPVDWSHICAWDYTSATCNGDSGGPISAKITIDGMARVVQFGIVSYGPQKCKVTGLTGVTGVYTNVLHHMNFIINAVRLADV